MINREHKLYVFKCSGHMANNIYDEFGNRDNEIKVVPIEVTFRILASNQAIAKAHLDYWNQFRSWKSQVKTELIEAIEIDTIILEYK